MIDALAFIFIFCMIFLCVIGLFTDSKRRLAIIGVITCLFAFGFILTALILLIIVEFSKQ